VTTVAGEEFYPQSRQASGSLSAQIEGRAHGAAAPAISFETSSTYNGEFTHYSRNPTRLSVLPEPTPDSWTEGVRFLAAWGARSDERRPSRREICHRRCPFRVVVGPYQLRSTVILC
jgi:hypothetical protein